MLLQRGVGEGATFYPGLLHFTLDTYLILLSVKQGSIKYHLSLWPVKETGDKRKNRGEPDNSTVRIG